MMKYLDLIFRNDLKRTDLECEYIKSLQDAGDYPKCFSYPLALQFELTGKCNLKCKHCYNRSGDVDVVSSDVMTPEKWENLARQIVSDGGIFQCIISGGEPLMLGRHLYEIMDILHDDGTSFIMITNGLLLNKATAKRLSKYRYYWFQISIDGSTAKIHDEFRGVKGSWNKAVIGAMEISNLGIPLVIAHTVTRKNLDDVENMVTLACNLGVGKIMIGEVLPSGRAAFNEDIILKEDEREQLYKKISDLNKKYTSRIVVERSVDIRISLKRYCSQPNRAGIIRSNGDFRMDCMVPFTIGNVNESSIKDIWERKGINAWNDSKVKDFIMSVNSDQKGCIANHVYADIRL